MSILRFRHFSHPLKTNTHINQINPLYRPALYLVHENFACIACTGTPQKASFYTLDVLLPRYASPILTGFLKNEIVVYCDGCVCVCVCVFLCARLSVCMSLCLCESECTHTCV